MGSQVSSVNAAREAALLDDFVFHTLRHRCATRLVESGVDLQITKGWMDIATSRQL
jgi:site-specific recombinase XerD